MIMKAKPKFEPGQICATPGALEAMNEAEQTPMEFIGRHLYGDWGEVCADDQQANEEALEHTGFGCSVLTGQRRA